MTTIVSAKLAIVPITIPAMAPPERDEEDVWRGEEVPHVEPSKMYGELHAVQSSREVQVEHLASHSSQEVDSLS